MGKHTKWTFPNVAGPIGAFKNRVVGVDATNERADPMLLRWAQELDSAAEVTLAHIEEQKKTRAGQEVNGLLSPEVGGAVRVTPDPRVDPMGYMAANTQPKPRRPWTTIPAASIAPPAVRAIRARRIARIKLVDRAPDFDVLAKHALQSPSASASDKAWAASWLSTREAK